MRLLLLLLTLAELFFASQALADEPIVFRRADDACYRIPSIALTDNGYLAVAQKRRGIRGRRVCGDDGTVDLVGKSSTDGKTWSSERMIVSSDDFSRKLASPGSNIYDPAFAGVPEEARLVKVGSQGMVASGSDVYLMFVGQYNIEAQCDDRRICVNSPENLKAGAVKARYFLIRSADGGKSWGEPVRVHAAIYQSCVADLIGDRRLREAVDPLFDDDAKAGASTYETFSQIQDALGYRDSANVESAANLLKVPAALVQSNVAVLQMLFKPDIRVGPGNGIAFPHGGGTRLLFPAAPFTFHTDDGGRTFHCGNTTTIERGSERQAAWLGGDTVMLSLRMIRAKPGDPDSVRVFSISRDAGATWSEDRPISVGGHDLIPDAIAQASIAAISGSNPPSVLHINLANTGHSIKRMGKRGRERTDYRSNLSAVRIYLEPGGLMPATTDGCAPRPTGANVAYKVVWPGSAAYSAAVYAPRSRSVGVLFEASDNVGPALAYRAWAEAIRFADVPVASMPGAEPDSKACKAGK